MALRPAYEIDLTHDGHTVTLRASLRAAVAIGSRPEGFAGLVDQVSRQSLTGIRAVVVATAPDRREANSFLAAIDGKPLAYFLVDAQAACLSVMTAIFPESDDSADKVPSTGATSTMPLREYFQSLYRFATGWLGWTPSETWAASPAEIEAAFGAHTERLIAMNGGVPSDSATASGVYTAERLREIEEQGFDPTFDREGLRALKARHES